MVNNTEEPEEPFQFFSLDIVISLFLLYIIYLTFVNDRRVGELGIATYFPSAGLASMVVIFVVSLFLREVPYNKLLNNLNVVLLILMHLNFTYSVFAYEIFSFSRSLFFGSFLPVLITVGVTSALLISDLERFFAHHKIDVKQIMRNVNFKIFIELSLRALVLIIMIFNIFAYTLLIHL